MADYKPELGQAIFGQPAKQYEVPDIWHAALAMLRDELDRAMWNLHQQDYASPFGNTGNRFDECTEFTVEAYSWDDEVEQPFNFKWRDVEIGWYKYLGRGMSANRELTPDLAAEMLGECLLAVKRYEAPRMREKVGYWPDPECPSSDGRA